MTGWRRVAAVWALALAAVSTTAACRGAGGGDSRDNAGSGLGSTATLPAPPESGPGGGEAPPAEIPAVGVGETVSGAGYELVVHEVTAPAPAPAPEAAPGPGHMLVTVDVEVVNRTASDRDATYLRLELIDDSGTYHQASPHSERPPTGWIPPERPQRWVQVYEVPMLATGLTLILRPDLVSGVAAAVRLG